MNELVKKIKEERQALIALCRQYKYIYIYGNGIRGNEQYNFLAGNQIDVTGYVVSNKKVEDNLSQVITYKQLNTPSEETLIILALNSVYHKQILEQLKSIGYTNIYITNLYLRTEFFIEEYEKKGVDFSKETIEIAGYKMSNIFLNSLYCDDAIIEIYDLIMPYVANYKYIDEGPYEYGGAKLKQGDIVFDCGANIGMFSVIAATRGCTCYAFEPTPITLVELEKNAVLYDGAIHIEPYAVSDYEGKTEFNIFDNPGRNSFINQEGIAKIKVDTITIDEFVKREKIARVDFIKADIEGAERNMLKGAEKTIKEFKPQIAICTYHLEDDKEILESILHSYVPEYKIVHKWKKLYAWIE